MDQIKTQLAVALKYGFWIGTSIILIASLAVWYMTTSKLAEESAAQASAITTAISTVSSVQAELSTQPNEHSHEEMKRMIAKRQDEVLESWKTLYDRQRDILTWPVKELKQDFVDEFKDMIPVERFVEFPTLEADEKETTVLNRYSRYIKNVLPDIAKIANAEWTAEFESSMAMGMGMDMGMDSMMMGGPTRRTGVNVDITGADEGPLVQWSSGSQQQVLGDLFPWRGSQPSTLEVYYSQENIWILKQLLQIIDDVNGDARQPYQAKIHEITGIGIGKSVKFGAGNVSKPGSRAAMGGMGGMGGMDMDMMDMMDDEMMDSMGDMEDMGGMLGTGTQIDPADNRYVNASLEPIAGSALRAALTSNSPNDASLAVAKRVPVMMSLNMDQRAVHELLAVCGSSPLMVEVQQVRVLPKRAGGMGGMGGMGGEDMEDMEMGMGGMGMGGMGMGGMGMGGMGMGAGGLKDEEEFPLDMSVEIYGIIYMYNPPDPVKLGVEQVTEDTIVGGATETLGGEKVAPPPSPQPDGVLPTPQTPAPQVPAAPDAQDPAAPVAGVRATAPPRAMLPTAQP